MAYAVWPSTLQQCINESSFSFEIGDTTLRSDMDVGPAKTRRRFTKPINKMGGSINLKFTEYPVLYNFYETTLNGGTQPFLFTHPISKVQALFRFLTPPQFSPLGGQYFVATLQLEELPQ